MIRTDFTQGNQFVFEVPIEWISTARYQQAIYCMLKKKEPDSELHVVADEKVLGTNRHVIGEEHGTIDEKHDATAASVETFASSLHDEAVAKPRHSGSADVPPPTADGDGTPSLPRLATASVDREAWRHVNHLIENWYEPSEVPSVAKEQESGRAPDNLVVASGVVSALESLRAKDDKKYDERLIRRTIHIVTQDPTPEGLLNALKPLFLKKKEKRLPAARMAKSMEQLVALVKRQGEIGEKMMEKEEEVKSLIVEQANQLKRHVTRRVGQLKKPNSRKPGPTMSEERRDDMRRVHAHVKEGYSVSKACDMVEAENRERGASVAHYASAAAMRDAYGRWKPAK